MSNRREVTVVSQMFYPDTISTARVMTDIAEGIADEFDVKVVCQNRSYVDPSRFLEDNELPGTSVKIDRIKVPGLDKNKMLSRIILTAIVSRNIRNKLKETNSDVYLSVSNPPSLPVLVGRHARKASSKFIYLVHDLYPDVLAKLGYISESSKVFKYMKRATEEALELADSVVVLGRDVKEYLNNKYGISNDKIKIIPNWIPNPSESLRKIEPFNRDSSFRLVYAGNLGETAEIELLIQAVRKFDGVDFELYIIGGGKFKNYYEKLTNQLGIKNVTFTGYLEDMQYEEHLSRADGFFVSLKKDLYGISVPSKTYHYLKYRKPILGLLPENSEIALLIEETNSGIVCSDYNVDALADSIKSIIEYEAVGDTDIVVNPFSRERAIASFKSIL
ncbi:glycosyltransferase family 4 protein [Mesotoga sp. H07.pep.5.3]|uniref:glycosyltransferase family 4 protein n=1 Tax=Mesotoga sp. H07.pep.5.3 TaxID=1421003 RepID=UPI000C17E1A4|nr:glycosyltransferase family 4 protein [Mesotoga sp. H07.pep.5.3]PIJ63030.1 hypothetical protein V513_02715 [Mesotoga sp. H07.pep.5.3]